MKQGDPFNISKVWPEIRIPLGMISDRRISFCAKVVYGLLVRYSGSAGFCSVHQEKIAKDLNISKVLVKAVVKMMKKEKYIMVKRQGSGRPAIYYFLWRNDFKLSTGGVHRININPEIHKNILEYYEKMDEKIGGIRGQERRKEDCA